MNYKKEWGGKEKNIGHRKCKIRKQKEIAVQMGQQIQLLFLFVFAI